MNRLFLPLVLALAACNPGGGEPANAAPKTDNKPAPAAAAQPAAAAAAGGGEVVATIGDEKITMADLDQAVGRELFEMRQRALDELVTRKVLESAAKKAGKSVDDFVKTSLEARVPNVSDAEAEAFFNQNKAQLPPDFQTKTFAEVKDQLVQGLTQQKRREAGAAFLEELKKQEGVKVLFEAPRVEVAAIGPSKGPADAPVTIVEFSDFECPFCSRGKEAMEQVLAAYPGKVRVVFRDFPLTFHQNAAKAGEAGHCADEQGKFWEMHDWMFDNQRSLDVASLGNGAAAIGLDRGKFDACLSSGRHAGKVAGNMADGQKVGVSGTPAFFVNGVMISGAQPFEKFKEIIDRELAKKGG
jgi:protein-disulfide isomerase